MVREEGRGTSANKLESESDDSGEAYTGTERAVGEAAPP